MLSRDNCEGMEVTVIEIPTAEATTKEAEKKKEPKVPPIMLTKPKGWNTVSKAIKKKNPSPKRLKRRTSVQRTITGVVEDTRASQRLLAFRCEAELPKYMVASSSQ